MATAADGARGLFHLAPRDYVDMLLNTVTITKRYFESYAHLLNILFLK